MAPARPPPSSLRLAHLAACVLALALSAAAATPQPHAVGELRPARGRASPARTRPRFPDMAAASVAGDGSLAAAARKRVLLTDVLFPNTMAAWRLNEVSAFMDRFDTDILVVLHGNENMVTHQFSFDWDELAGTFGLDRYDLLILDPAFNKYDRVNAAARADGRPRCNGTAFNGALAGKYMLRLRKYGDDLSPRVDETVYEAVHHIFLASYRRFTEAYPAYPQSRQSIHLYPGGGFLPSTVGTKPYAIHGDVLLFPTQAFTMDYLARFNPNNTAVPVFGAPYILAGGQPVVEKRAHAPMQPLIACFTSLGAVAEKGADLYVAIAEAYRAAHPSDGVIFVGVGVVPPSPAVVHLAPMPQAALDAFYEQSVDIIFNLDRTDRRHGWPLGVEAMIQGAVLFSTDRQQLNAGNGYRFGEEVHIVEEGRFNDTVARLHDYYSDAGLLRRHSVAGQRRVHDLFGYANQMAVILDAIDRRMTGVGG